MDLKRILPIALIGVAVLSLVVWAVVFKPAATTAPLGNQTGISNPTTAPNQSQQAPTTPNTVAPVPDKPVSSSEPATLVPEGTDLQQYCEKYYVAWKKGDWQTAFDMQPLTKKQDRSVDDFSQSLQSYGMVDYEVGKPQISGHVGTVTVNLDMGQNGAMATHWTFVKNDKGQWTAQSSTTSFGQ